jgi:YegS/Rv2252/BmrU family lipid kinase
LAVEQKSEVSNPGDELLIRRVFVVLNPVAGLTDADEALELIQTFCQEQQWECDVYQTKPDDDVPTVVRQALEQKQPDLVLAAGGDGTVAGVVTGLANSNVPMAIIPAGTGNAMARNLNIPLRLEEALHLLKGPFEICTLDLMENGDQFFVLNIGIGVSSLTMRRTGRSEKRRFGMLAYLWRAAGTIIRSDMHRFNLTVDGKKYAVTATELMIANSRLMGLQPQIDGVEVEPNDGKLDLFIIRARNVRDYFNVLFGFFFNRRRNGNPNLRYLEVREVARIEAEFALPVQADGDDLGTTPIEVRLAANGIRVLIPG